MVTSNKFHQTQSVPFIFRTLAEGSQYPSQALGLGKKKILVKTASIMSVCILLNNDNNHKITVSHQDALGVQMTPLQSNMLGVDIFILKGFSRIFQERVSEICNQMIKRYTLCVVTEQDFTS